MDLIPRESIADFEGQMRGYAENQFDSEVQSGNIKLGGVMFVSSNPKFKDFKKSKFFQTRPRGESIECYTPMRWRANKTMITL